MAEKIILYYKFTPVSDPEATRKWQTVMAAERGLNGRVIISEHGINGTLGGEEEALDDYIEQMELTEHADFAGIEYKISDGSHKDFPKLSVKVRKELVTLAPDEEFDVYDKSTPLRPEQWHEFMEQNPDVTILDARNNYESAVGKFKNAITPDINAFKEIKPVLEELDKDKPLITYCTGDVRCEYLSAYMKHKGFAEVYHLEGGIVKYGEAFADDGFWDGACYVFDKRTTLKFSDDAVDLGECAFCETPTSRYRNCGNQFCNKRELVCENCAENEFCSIICKDEQKSRVTRAREQTAVSKNT